MAINWQFKVLDESEEHGDNVTKEKLEFESKSKSKSFINSMFASATCIDCGSHRLEGSGILVEICHVKKYMNTKEKGFFGGDKWVDKLIENIWRIGDFESKEGGFLKEKGIVKCLSCKERSESDDALDQVDYEWYIDDVFSDFLSVESYIKDLTYRLINKDSDARNEHINDLIIPRTIENKKIGLSLLAYIKLKEKMELNDGNKGTSEKYSKLFSDLGEVAGANFSPDETISALGGDFGFLSKYLDGWEK